ncbi:hypothetical protein [Paenibacillus macerans]|uniref:hypothetical protein n=1 Tax=Paenibacillus macerans TaxID=44252 RepID=UPI00399CCD5D
MGVTKQYGHHLPLDVDIFLAEGLALRASAELGAITLPLMPFRYYWVWQDIPRIVSQ